VADGTGVEWTDATWNPITGCSVHSAGCKRCYAMLLAGTRLSSHPSRIGLTKEVNGHHVWTGEVRFNEQWLAQPIRWAKPRRIFVVAHGDLFHEAVPDEWIDRIFAVMALCPQHQFQVLTKRSARMREYMRDRAGKLARHMIDEYLIKGSDGPHTGRAINVAWPVKSIGDIDDPDDVTMRHWPLTNVWLGVSVEDQHAANERIPDLLATPAAVRWLSCEPLIGPVDLTMIEFPNERGGMECWDALDLHLIDGAAMQDNSCDATLGWVVAGGESGAEARPMHPDWARSLRDQCAAAGVPFLFKQWGEWAPASTISFGKAAGAPRYDGCEMPMYRLGKKAAGRLLDGVEHNGFPA
jgi:protein gp37